nr:MAG TPA: hypothetical protein [Caudoviricetes sp.]
MATLFNIKFFLLKSALYLYLELGKLTAIPVDNYVVLVSII